MKKIWAYIVSGVVIVALAIYFIFNNQGSVVSMNNPDETPSTTPPTPTTTPATTPSSTPGTTPPNPSGYKDGVYTGSVADAIYGKLQVVATIKNGKIVDTTCPLYPNDPGHTMQVSQSALPQLKQEAIAIQSANVNIISGATQTSEAYQQSLASALAQAKS